MEATLQKVWNLLDLGALSSKNLDLYWTDFNEMIKYRSHIKEKKHFGSLFCGLVVVTFGGEELSKKEIL